MDRSIVYAGAAAQDVDMLFPQRGAMQALGMLAQMVLGDVGASGPLVNGLSITPTAPASMQVVMEAGAMFGLDAVDGTAYGTLAADTAHQIIQIAVNLDPVTLPALAPPTGSGQSQCFLIEAQALQSDTGEVVLPFWNAANTAQPFLGMANNAGSLPTQRVRRVIAQAVAGAVASTGSPTSPNPTTGWTPLATIIVSAGQTTITSGNIAPYVPGPQLSFTLPQLSPGFSRSTVLTSGAGSSGGNAGSFIVPAGVKTLKVTYTGGGGGGSACQASGANTAICGGSGGAGATQIAIISVTPGQSLSWLVGLGGASQSDGGATSFSGLAVAAGGHGAPGFSGSGSSISSPGGAGGQAVGNGFSGGDGTDGQNGGTVSIGGVGGASYWGGGGRAGAGKGVAGAITLQGQNGRAWGAGGGGTNDLSNTNVNFPGGAGAPGIIVIEY